MPLFALAAIALSASACRNISIANATGPRELEFASAAAGPEEEGMASEATPPTAAGQIQPSPVGLASLPLFNGNWDDFPSYPVPDGNPVPLGPEVFRSGFRDPLPASPVWNPPGPKRVGIQAGHWLTDQVPQELWRLSPGSSAGGWAEWQVNLLIARETARILEDAGVVVDLLPTTIPVRYRAQAFISIHADGDTAGAFRGYKITRPGFSSVPEADNALVAALYDEYGATTGLPRDSDAHISLRMIYYYAFNTRRYQHALDVGTPSAIIEAGFLTSSVDRAFLTGRPEIAAQGIANGLLRFLGYDLGARAA